MGAFDVFDNTPYAAKAGDSFTGAIYAPVGQVGIRVGDTFPSTQYRFKVSVDNGGNVHAMRIDQSDTTNAKKALEVNMASKELGLALTHTGWGATTGDAVNITNTATGLSTTLQITAQNTGRSTLKVTNSGAQTDGAVIAAVMSNTSSTVPAINVENHGQGYSYNAEVFSDSIGGGVQVFFDPGYAGSALGLNVDGQHTSGTLAQVVNRLAQTAGQVVLLRQAHASSTAALMTLTQAGTGDIINANSGAFVVQSTGNVKTLTVFNTTSFNNARVQLPTTGIVIDRNVADANPALIIDLVNASSTAAIVQYRAAGAQVARVDKAGRFITKSNAAPADADLAAGEMATWFDSTNGAAKFMVKVKQADGTVRTGSLALA